MIRVGLIGCGGIGAVHATCWLSMENVTLVAVADADEKRTLKYAEQFGAVAYSEGYELLERTDLDVIDICLPTFLHTRYLLGAMERAKHVIVEKPLCLKEAEVQQIQEVQQRTGAIVHVAHVVRFADSYRYLKEIKDSGVYGKVIAGDFKRISPRPVWMKGHDDRDRTGTMVLDMHIHDTDFIRWLMGGEPDTIKVDSVLDKNGIVQHIWTGYHYGDTVLCAEGSWDYPENFPFIQSFRVRMERAAVVLDDKGILTVYPADGEVIHPDIRKKQEMDAGINVSDLSPYLNEIKTFADVIGNGKEDRISPLSEAIASFRLAAWELKLAEEGDQRKIELLKEICEKRKDRA